MADQPTPEPSLNLNAPRPDLNAPRPTGRPVYESTLLPERRHRRLPPWLVIPVLLLALLVLLYFLIFAPKPRRFVDTEGRLVYASDEGSPGVTHLWTMGTDGSEARRITARPAASPAFTADGSQVAFSSQVGGQNQIFIADADGRNPLPVTRTAGAKLLPAFAPGSNTLLGFLSGASLAVMEAGKGDAALLLPSAGGAGARPDAAGGGQAREAAAVTSFAWRPGQIADKPGLAAVLDSGGTQTLAVLPSLDAAPRLTQNDQPDGLPLADADALSLAWSPDGARIAVALLHAPAPGGKTVSGLALFDAAGGFVRRLFLLPPGSTAGPQNPVFSPDGAQIAVEVWHQPDLARRSEIGLFLVPLQGPDAGSGPPRLLARGECGAARFSADGGQVFFLARRADGGHDLIRINASGAGARRISDGHMDVSAFALSPQAARP